MDIGLIHRTEIMYNCVFISIFIVYSWIYTYKLAIIVVFPLTYSFSLFFLYILVDFTSYIIILLMLSLAQLFLGTKFYRGLKPRGMFTPSLMRKQKLLWNILTKTVLNFCLIAKFGLQFYYAWQCRMFKETFHIES